MIVRPIGALSPLLARMRSAYRLCNYLLIGLERKSSAQSRNGANGWNRRTWNREGPGTEMAGQVCQSLIFSNVSNNDRRPEPGRA